MNLKAWILTGSLPDIHPAGVILLVAFLSISILFRKSFCSWLCPVGTISETLWQFGDRLFGRNFLLPRWLDLVLRSLKYLLLLLFVYAIGTMSVAAIRQFLDGPYGVVADVKMLNFFRQMSSTSAVVVSVLIVSSVFVKNFWCRYLCPYGALLGIVSWFSPLSIRRNSELCVNCGKCSTACPARIPVDDLEVVRSPECLGCYRCVAACPSKKAVEMALGKGRIVKPVWFALGISALFLGLVLAARISGNWHTELPDKTYLELVPSANRYSHP
jgi:polyferredoxin